MESNVDILLKFHFSIPLYSSKYIKFTMCWHIFETSL